MKQQTQHLKEYFDLALQEVKQGYGQDVLQVHHLEQYKSELEQPYKKINKDIEDMKRSYHDLATAMDMQRQKKQIDKDID